MNSLDTAFSKPPESATQPPVFRAGLVGCGEVAQRYSTALARAEKSGLRLVSVTDAAEPAGRRFAEAAGVRFAPGLESMLAEDIDLVCICTPNASHAELAEFCLEHGKHVLLEHPMATTVPAAERLSETARRTRRELFIVRQRRYLATIQMVRMALHLGLLGTIRSVHASICWNRRPSYYTEKSWRSEHGNGGVVLNQASHFLDILLLLFGEPLAARMQKGNVRHHVGVEDSAVGSIDFQSVCAIFECTTAAPEGGNRTRLKIEGDKHCLELGGSGWEKFTSAVPAEIAALEALLEPPVNGDHSGYFERVARRLAGENISVVDAEEGIRAVRLIDELYAGAMDRSNALAVHFVKVFQET